VTDHSTPKINIEGAEEEVGWGRRVGLLTLTGILEEKKFSMKHIIWMTTYHCIHTSKMMM